VDEALSFGWIDGVRQSLDDVSYTIRFTPRTARSTWSAANIKRATELIEAGSMRPAGRKAFEARRDERSGIYSYEQRGQAELGRQFERQFRSNTRAWEFFRAHSRISNDGHLLGRQREARRDQAKAAGDTDRRLGA